MLQLRLITSVVPRGGGLSVHKVRGVLWYVASPSVVTAAYNAGCGWNERPFRPNRGTPFSPHLLLCDFFKPPWVPKLDRAPVTGQPCLMGWLSVPLTWRRFNEPSPSWRLSECITLCAFMCARVASESPAVASHFFCFRLYWKHLVAGVIDSFSFTPFSSLLSFCLPPRSLSLHPLLLCLPIHAVLTTNVILVFVTLMATIMTKTMLTLMMFTLMENQRATNDHIICYWWHGCAPIWDSQEWPPCRVSWVHNLQWHWWVGRHCHIVLVKHSDLMFSSWAQIYSLVHPVSAQVWYCNKGGKIGQQVHLQSHYSSSAIEEEYQSWL